MIVVRLLAVLASILIGAAVVAFLWTRDRRWLRFAGQVFRLSVVVGLLIAVLYVLERLL